MSDPKPPKKKPKEEPYTPEGPYPLDRDLADYLSRLFACSALQTKGEMNAASQMVKNLGLPSHHDAQKNWDTLKCLLHILSMGRPDMRVLDAGGIRSVILRWLYMMGITKLHGCDLRPWNAESLAGWGIDFSVQDLTKTSYPDNYFDAVTSISVIEHNVPFQPMLKEMRRIMTPGGRLLVSTDYWSEHIDCTGIFPYGKEGGQMHVLEPSDIRQFVELAEQEGFRLTAPLDLSTRDRTVRWERVDREYTFMFLALVKE